MVFFDLTSPKSFSNSSLLVKTMRYIFINYIYFIISNPKMFHNLSLLVSCAE